MTDFEKSDAVIAFTVNRKIQYTKANISSPAQRIAPRGSMRKSNFRFIVGEEIVLLGFSLIDVK
jgi:hypothetical protein